MAPPRETMIGNGVRHRGPHTAPPLKAKKTEAVERACRHRSRLTETERYLTEALYHSRITSDRDAEIRAYEAVLRLDPMKPAALNNLANIQDSIDQGRLAGIVGLVLIMAYNRFAGVFGVGAVGAEG